MRDILQGYKIFNIDPKKLRSKDFFKNMLEYRHKIMDQCKDAHLSPGQFSCPLCAGKEGFAYLSYREYQLFECAQCHLVSPLIKWETLKKIEIYDDDAYVKDTTREIVDTYEYRKQIYAPERMNYIEEKISDIPRSEMKILDLGCGPGYFIDYLKDRGIAYKGIELARFLVEICRKRGLHVEETRLEDEPIKGYNIITMFDVLVHLTDPAATFTALNEKLMPGGYVLAYTPHVHSLAYYLMQGEQNTLLPFQHLCFFDRMSLEFLAHKTGFKIHSLDYYGLDVMDYLYKKQHEDGYDYHGHLQNFIPVMQAIIDKQNLSNHMRVIFKKM